MMIFEKETPLLADIVSYVMDYQEWNINEPYLLIEGIEDKARFQLHINIFDKELTDEVVNEILQRNKRLEDEKSSLSKCMVVENTKEELEPHKQQSNEWYLSHPRMCEVWDFIYCVQMWMVSWIDSLSCGPMLEVAQVFIHLMYLPHAPVDKLFRLYLWCTLFEKNGKIRNKYHWNFLDGWFHSDESLLSCPLRTKSEDIVHKIKSCLLYNHLNLVPRSLENERLIGKLKSKVKNLNDDILVSRWTSAVNYLRDAHYNFQGCFAACTKNIPK